MSEYDFISAILRTGRAMISSKNRDLEVEGEDLAKYLRSDLPLEPVHRNLLAHLVLGELGNPVGAKKVTSEDNKVQEVCWHYLDRTKAGDPATAIRQDCADRFGISLRTVDSYVKLGWPDGLNLSDSADK